MSFFISQNIRFKKFLIVNKVKTHYLCLFIFRLKTKNMTKYNKEFYNRCF